MPSQRLFILLLCLLTANPTITTSAQEVTLRDFGIKFHAYPCLGKIKGTTGSTPFREIEREDFTASDVLFDKDGFDLREPLYFLGSQDSRIRGARAKERRDGTPEKASVLPKNGYERFLAESHHMGLFLLPHQAEDSFNLSQVYAVRFSFSPKRPRTEESVSALSDLPSLKLLQFDFASDSLIAIPYVRSGAIMEQEYRELLMILTSEAAKSVIAIELPTGSFTDNRLMGIVTQLDNLRGLSLAYSDVKDRGTWGLQRLKQLEVLNLDGCFVSNETLEICSKIKTLRSLSLNGCPLVTDVDLAHFKDHPALLEIRAANTQITEAGLATLHKNCPTFRYGWLDGRIPFALQESELPRVLDFSKRDGQ